MRITAFDPPAGTLSDTPAGAGDPLRVTREAIASRAAGSLHDAQRLMDEAMDAAVPHGHVRSFVDNGAPMAALLREVAGYHHAKALRLLGAFPKGGRAAPDGLVEPLSGRELEVLDILDCGPAPRCGYTVQVSQRILAMVR